jgi:hypothetical protein
MPVDVSWYEAEEKNIIYHFIGRWTWEECYAALDKAALFLDKIDYPVTLIVDFHQTSHMPPANFESLNRIARADAPNHPNTRGLVVIGLKRGISMVFNVFQKIFPKAAARYNVAKDQSELDTFLAVAEN